MLYHLTPITGGFRLHVQSFPLWQSTTFTTPFTTSTTSKKWQNFLATPPGTTILHICTLFISYHSRKQKTLLMQMNVQDLEYSFPPTTPYQTTILDWLIPQTIGTGTSWFQSGGSIAIINGRLENNIQFNVKRREELENGIKESVQWWQTYAVVWENQKVEIYNWDFVRDQRFMEVGLVYSLIKKKMDRKMAVKEGWVGGGKNLGEECQEMTKQRVYDEIVAEGGQNLRNWEERGWKRL